MTRLKDLQPTNRCRNPCLEASVGAHVQAPPNRRADLQEQDVELVNFDRKAEWERQDKSVETGQITDILTN